MADDEVVRGFEAQWSKLAAIEMEGGASAAALHMSRRAGRRFLMIRGVQDFADKNKDDTWRLYAADAAAAFARALLEDGPCPALRVGNTPGPATAAAPPAPASPRSEPLPTVETRARDLGNLRELWTTFPADLMDYFFDRADFRIVPYAIFYYYEGDKGQRPYRPRSIFTILETREAVRRGFVRPLLRCIPGSEFMDEMPGGEQYKFIPSHRHNDHDEWATALEAYQAAVVEGREGYERLVSVTRRKWPEIDLAETSREAVRRKRKAEGSFEDAAQVRRGARASGPPIGRHWSRRARRSWCVSARAAATPVRLEGQPRQGRSLSRSRRRPRSRCGPVPCDQRRGARRRRFLHRAAIGRRRVTPIARSR